MVTELRLSGFGGQGVILAASILGKAAAVVEGRHATMNQAFGPEARGSACSAQLLIDDEPIAYPYVRRSDILVAMSQDAYKLFVDEVRDGGTVLIDEDLVTPDEILTARVLSVPATRIAETIGKRIMANMVMLGFLASTTGLLAADAVREALRTSVPCGTEENNLAAFDAGYAHGQGLIADSGKELSRS